MVSRFRLQTTLLAALSGIAGAPSGFGLPVVQHDVLKFLVYLGPLIIIVRFKSEFGCRRFFRSWTGPVTNVLEFSYSSLFYRLLFSLVLLVNAATAVFFVRISSRQGVFGLTALSQLMKGVAINRQWSQSERCFLLISNYFALIAELFEFSWAVFVIGFLERKTNTISSTNSVCVNHL